MTKKILVIGNGGREHAIIEALSRSPQKPELYNFATAINPGIQPLVKEIHVGDIMDLEQTKAYAKKIKPNFAVIGPDDPIGNGSADVLKELGIRSFAPSAQCAQLEGSKSFTRNLLKKYHIDASPDFEVFTEMLDTVGRKDFFDRHEGQIVVKADGLLGGKGVLVAGDHFTDFEEAEDFAKKSIEKFGRVVLEEKLIGEEFSLISLVDGKTVLDTPAIQDHKRAFTGDTGPNTGGMGCISDENNRLPFITEQDVKDAHEITVKTMQAMEAELHERYVGVMYGGFIVTKNGVKLIEYNARFGDPEALNIFPILKTDFVDICEKAIHGELDQIGELEFAPQATVVKYLCPEGYPTNPVKNVPISVGAGLQPDLKTGTVYYASVAEEDGQIVLKGSRAVGCVGIGDSLEQANQHCEALIRNFSGPVFYRKDIGTQELIQQRIDTMKKIRGQ